jgi:hypothetical protein
MKQSKVALSRKLKDESEKHRKWQQNRTKELLQWRNQGLKKDKLIQRLERENKK